jgi:hypothetical protein
MPAPDPRITDEMRRIAERIADAYQHAEDPYDLAAAVLPLIEQAVIERLAGEAGEPPSNPYGPPLHPAWAGSEYVAYEDGYEAGAAAGVAAERARADDVDGWRVYCHNGADASASVAHVLTPGDSVTFHDCESIHVRFDPDNGGPDAA